MKSETHESRTDPEAVLKRKRKKAKLVFMGHALMENRNRRLMDFVVSSATGTAERDAVTGLMDDARIRLSILEALQFNAGCSAASCMGNRPYQVRTIEPLRPAVPRNMI